jgi:uncharacterized radical SAM protein YgiQ
VFLPVTKADMLSRGWHYLDFICVTGDAYVDHPSFGIAIISRVLEAQGYKVGIIAQPDLKNPDAFKSLGRPRYGFFVTGGNIDSMVAHYTVAKKRRSSDFYSPGGKMGGRPDRAVIAYTSSIKKEYPDLPVVIGGIEASLRRFAHYDYWDDAVRRPILFDSGADLVVYGMGEHQTVEVANRLKKGEKPEQMADIRGICFICDAPYFTEHAGDTAACPSFEEVSADKMAYAVACRIQYDNQDAVNGRAIAQGCGGRYLWQTAPALPLETAELDPVFALPYERYYHPLYEKDGGVPAIEEVEFSLAHNRGCFGACNFCSIAFHQGRRVTARSEDAVVAEAVELTKSPHFKGYIHDVGGPTANFRIPSCKKQLKNGLCPGRKCLAPKPCANLEVSHSEYLALLRRLRALPGVKKVFIRSGLRFDYMMADKDDSFFRELVAHHVSGQLKVAPEHCSTPVLDKMGKPHIETYLAFSRKFYALSQKTGKKQYLVPYLMSSHPGSTLKDAVELALFLKRERIKPEQVQDFYPTPGTVSTCMYYAGLDPFSMKPVFIPRDAHEKAMQRALLQYFIPKNRALVSEALKKAGRPDLIGFSKECLIKPYERKEQKVPEQKAPERKAPERKQPERRQSEQKRQTTRGSDKKQWRGKWGG